MAAGGCEKNVRDKEGDIHIEEFSCSGCKDQSEVSVRTAPEIQEYVEYAGNKDGYLYIRHVNVLLNCCPDTIKATASLNVLLIRSVCYGKAFPDSRNDLSRGLDSKKNQVLHLPPAASAKAQAKVDLFKNKLHAEMRLQRTNSII